MAARSARRGLATLAGTFAGCGMMEGFADSQQHERVTYNRGYTAADDYPNFAGCHSYTAQVLSLDLWKVCWKMTTPGGQSFKQLIQPAVDCPSNPTTPSVGCYIGDEQGFDIFADFLHKLIKVRHPGWSTENRQTQCLQPDMLTFERLPDDYVVACRVRGCRNFHGYRFPPTMKRGERRELETLLKLVLSELPGVYRGQYYSVGELGGLEREAFESAGLLFQKPTSPELVTAGFTRDWPDARGFYKSNDQELLFWINESDHFKIISQKKGGDMKNCFAKYATALTTVEYNARRAGKYFMHDASLGYLGPSVANLGTSMRASLQVKLPLVSKHPGLPEYLSRNKLTCTPLNAPGGVIELANSERLMKTETDLITNLANCTQQLITFEKALESGKSIKLLR